MSDWRDKLRNAGCELCPLHADAQHVCLMGSGPPQAKVMIVGEAPGQREDEGHKAFVGPAGKLLDAMLRDFAKVKRADCYVTNVVKCRPPANRTPHKSKETKVCVNEYFDREVQQVKPDFMLLLGNAPLYGVTGKSGITKNNGTVWRMEFGDGRPVKVFATLHPAAVLRNPKYGDTLMADLKRFGRLVRGKKMGGPKTQTKIIRTSAQFKWLVSQLAEARIISWDIETYTEPAEAPYVHTNFQDWHPDHSHIVSVAFTWQEGQAAVLPLWHKQTPWKQPDEVWARLEPVLTRRNAHYVGHNGKFDARWAASKGFPVPQTFDTMLAAHMLEENRPKGLKPLSQTLLGAPPYDVGEELKAAHTIPLRRLAVYNGKDTDYTYRLAKVFAPQLREDPRTAKIFTKLMMPASEALVDIERHGVWIDPKRWRARHDEAQERVAKLYSYINQYVPKSLRPINLNSPPQMAKLFFEHLELPVIEKTKTGAASTREGVLLQLMRDHPHPAMKALLKYRKWAKFLSTYLLPWWFEHMDGNGRIHSNYKLFGTVTGRLSGEGGIQQVPRDPFIRSIIGAPKGKVFLQADYSQIELRIAAMIANEKRMLRQYAMGEDIHMLRAMKMTGKLAKDVSKEERKKAKAVNFGYIYGMGAKKFVIYAFENYEVVITEAEATVDRNGFFEDYPALRPWHERQRRLARRYKMVRSPIGRARHLPDILSADPDVQAESERQAINSPVQSMASDMMLMSLVELHRNQLDPDKASIVGTVHDSILFEVREDVAEETAFLVKEVMEDVDRVQGAFDCRITVPIIADVEVGTHWAEPRYALGKKGLEKVG